MHNFFYSLYEYARLSEKILDLNTGLYSSSELLCVNLEVEYIFKISLEIFQMDFLFEN